MFPSVYSLPACLISHYSKLIAGKLEGGGKKKPVSRGGKVTSLGRKTEFLSALMWGSDVYDGFPVINQTAACLSLGWPPVQGTPAPPGGASEGALWCSPSSYLPILPPSPTWQLSPLRWWGSPSAEVPKKGAGGGSLGAENTEGKAVNNKWESRKQEIKEMEKGRRRRGGEEEKNR